MKSLAKLEAAGVRLSSLPKDELENGEGEVSFTSVI